MVWFDEELHEDYTKIFRSMRPTVNVDIFAMIFSLIPRK